MIEHKFPLQPSSDNLEPWISPEDVTEIVPLPGWHNSIFRVRDRSGTQYVLRVHVPKEGPEQVKPTLRIASVYGGCLPFVQSPLPIRSGDLSTTISGRVATLWPYSEGEAGSGKIFTSVTEPARCLAAIHQAGGIALAELGDLEAERWLDTDWRSNRRWSFGKVRDFLLSDLQPVPADVGPSELVQELDSATGRIGSELSRINAAEMVTIPIHGDFYPHNLIITPDGDIRAVVDWDDARLDWRTWDLANALLEFCAGPVGTFLNLERCHRFLAYYESAGGSLNSTERNALPLLIRARKLDELMYGLMETAELGVEDWDYLRSSISGWRQAQSLLHI